MIPGQALLAIDPGTIRIGYSYWIEGEGLVAYGITEAREHWKLDQRLKYLMESFLLGVSHSLDDEEHHEQYWVIEKPFVGENNRSALALSQAVGLLKCLAFQAHSEVLEVEAKKWQKEVLNAYPTTKRDELKKMSCVVATSLAGFPRSELIGDDNLADAICIGHYATSRLRMGKQVEGGEGAWRTKGSGRRSRGRSNGIHRSRSRSLGIYS